MSVSYMVREEVNAQTVIWAVARGVYRAGVIVGKVSSVAASIVVLACRLVMLLAAMAWKGKPSVETMVLAGKALALSSLCAAGMALVFLAPMMVVCGVGIFTYAVVTMPRAK